MARIGIARASKRSGNTWPNFRDCVLSRLWKRNFAEEEQPDRTNLSYGKERHASGGAPRDRHVKAYATPALLHAAFEMYRAFPANTQFNAAQRGPNDVPLVLAAGDGSPLSKLVPKIAEGLRANGCTHVETRLIRGSVHYVVEDQPEAVADLIERHAGWQP